MTILQEPRIDEANRLFEEQRFEIPCDYGGYRDWGCRDTAAARWIAVPSISGCGHAEPRLICTACRDFIITTQEAASCGRCQAIWSPFRRCFSHFEPLGTT